VVDIRNPHQLEYGGYSPKPKSSPPSMMNFLLGLFATIVTFIGIGLSLAAISANDSTYWTGAAINFGLAIAAMALMGNRFSN
jgi:hypothetical protein